MQPPSRACSGASAASAGSSGSASEGYVGAAGMRPPSSLAPAMLGGWVRQPGWPGFPEHPRISRRGTASLSHLSLIYASASSEDVRPQLRSYFPPVCLLCSHQGALCGVPPDARSHTRVRFPVVPDPVPGRMLVGPMWLHLQGCPCGQHEAAGSVHARIWEDVTTPTITNHTSEGDPRRR